MEKACVFFISSANTFSNILITNNSFENNWLISNEKSVIGSILYLDSPGNVIIRASNFINNKGILGGCIYYNEISENSLLMLDTNSFLNNFASLSGGALFLNSKYDQIDLKNNFFYQNYADNLENIVTTKPFRVSLNSLKNHKLFSLVILPGIIFQKLEFRILDYFGQELINYDEGFATITLIDQNNYHKDSSLSISGKYSVSIINGKFN